MALVNCCVVLGKYNKVLYPWKITAAHVSTSLRGMHWEEVEVVLLFLYHCHAGVVNTHNVLSYFVYTSLVLLLYLGFVTYSYCQTQIIWKSLQILCTKGTIHRILSYSEKFSRIRQNKIFADKISENGRLRRDLWLLTIEWVKVSRIAFHTRRTRKFYPTKIISYMVYAWCHEAL